MQDTPDITSAEHEYDFTQWKDTAQVLYNSGVTDGDARVRTSPWKAKLTTRPPFSLYLNIQYSFSFQ